MAKPSKLNGNERIGFSSTINKRKHYFGHDRATAKIKFNEVVLAASKGKTTADSTLAEVIAEYLDDKQLETKESTYRWYKMPLDDFLTFVGNKKLSAIIDRDFKRWLATNWATTRYGNPMSPNSIKQAKRCVKSLFKWCVKNKKLEENPAEELKVGLYTPMERIPTIEELKSLLAFYKDDEDFCDYLRFEILTGARVFESRTIRCGQVQLEDNEIILDAEQTKGFDRLNKPELRVIHLNEQAKQIVERNLTKHPEPKDLLFQNPTSKNSKGMWTTNCVRNRLLRAEKKLGFLFSQRSIRHFTCTELLDRKGTDINVSAVMGWTTTKMIANYSKNKNNKPRLLETANLLNGISI